MVRSISTLQLNLSPFQDSTLFITLYICIINNIVTIVMPKASRHTCNTLTTHAILQCPIFRFFLFLRSSLAHTLCDSYNFAKVRRTVEKTTKSLYDVCAIMSRFKYLDRKAKIYYKSWTTLSLIAIKVKKYMVHFIEKCCKLYTIVFVFNMVALPVNLGHGHTSWEYWWIVNFDFFMYT